MPVPKCKTCEHINQTKYDSGQTFRYCDNKKVSELGRYIRGNEHKTSPKWCPLRGVEDEKKN